MSDRKNAVRPMNPLEQVRVPSTAYIKQLFKDSAYVQELLKWSEYYATRPECEMECLCASSTTLDLLSGVLTTILGSQTVIDQMMTVYVIHLNVSSRASLHLPMIVLIFSFLTSVFRMIGLNRVR